MTRSAISPRSSSLLRFASEIEGFREDVVISVCFFCTGSPGTAVLLLGLKGDDSRFRGVCLAYVMNMANDRKHSADG